MKIKCDYCDKDAIDRVYREVGRTGLPPDYLNPDTQEELDMLRTEGTDDMEFRFHFVCQDHIEPVLDGDLC